MGNQSQDEVFLAAQEAVGAHRDSQGKIFVLIITTCRLVWTKAEYVVFYFPVQY